MQTKKEYPRRAKKVKKARKAVNSEAKILPDGLM